MDRNHRLKHIAEAFELIAITNHYMVGFVGAATAEELEMAKQILIVKSNKADNKNAILEKALDLLEVELKGAKI